MCLDFDTRESILREAAEMAAYMIRNKAWRRAKSEMKIMVETFEETDNDTAAAEFGEMVDKFIELTEKGCFDQ